MEFDDSVNLDRDPDDITKSVSPQIAATEKGDVYAVWSDNDIQFKEILDNGNWFSETISINNRKMLGTFPPDCRNRKRGCIPNLG